MFKPIESRRGAPEITFFVDGQAYRTRAGSSVAVALLEAGLTTFRRTSVSDAPRGPYCLMGACFECLVEVDGHQNVQACCTEVRNGMRVRLQTGPRRMGHRA